MLLESKLKQNQKWIKEINKIDTDRNWLKFKSLCKRGSESESLKLEKLSSVRLSQANKLHKQNKNQGTRKINFKIYDCRILLSNTDYLSTLNFFSCCRRFWARRKWRKVSRKARKMWSVEIQQTLWRYLFVSLKFTRTVVLNCYLCKDDAGFPAKLSQDDL